MARSIKSGKLQILCYRRSVNRLCVLSLRKAPADDDPGKLCYSIPMARIIFFNKPFRVLSDVPCPKCGAPMEVRVWKGGLYLSCSRYPECKTTRNLPPNVKYRYHSGRVELAEGLAEADDAPGSPCPKCGTPMQLKHGRYGRFLSCPNCGATAPVGTGVTCPKCGQGELVERYSPRRGTFWACNRYPDCRFILPGKPVETCPVCKKGVLYEDPRHGRRCSNPECPTRSG